MQFFKAIFLTFKIMIFCENQIFTFLLVGAAVFKVEPYIVCQFLAALIGQKMRYTNGKSLHNCRSNS